MGDDENTGNDPAPRQVLLLDLGQLGELYLKSTLMRDANNQTYFDDGYLLGRIEESFMRLRSFQQQGIDVGRSIDFVYRHMARVEQVKDRYEKSAQGSVVTPAVASVLQVIYRIDELGCNIITDHEMRTGNAPIGN
jgi:hypothetical protein